MKKICAKIVKSDEGVSGKIRQGAMNNLQPNFQIAIEVLIAQ